MPVAGSRQNSNAYEARKIHQGSLSLGGLLQCGGEGAALQKDVLDGGSGSLITGVTDLKTIESMRHLRVGSLSIGPMKSSPERVGGLSMGVSPQTVAPETTSPPEASFAVCTGDCQER